MPNLTVLKRKKKKKWKKNENWKKKQYLHVTRFNFSFKYYVHVISVKKIYNFPFLEDVNMF